MDDVVVGGHLDLHTMATDPEPRKRLRAFLANNFLLSNAEFPYGDDASLMEHGVVDSTGVLELILFLEQEFGVKVGDAEAIPRNLDTVARILAFVERKRNPTAAG